MVDPIVNMDVAAVMPVVTEAGGSFYRWKGTPGIQGKNALVPTDTSTRNFLSILKKIVDLKLKFVDADHFPLHRLHSHPKNRCNELDNQTSN